MKKTFAEVDHSGDIGLEAWGENLSELLENLTHGLFSLMYRGEVRPKTERRLEVSAGSWEDLAVDWLAEVIAMVGTHGEMYGAVTVEAAEGFSARGRLRGERVDQERHELRLDVKAATYHDLIVRKEKGGVYARVIFDL